MSARARTKRKRAGGDLRLVTGQRTQVSELVGLSVVGYRGCPGADPKEPSTPAAMPARLPAVGGLGVAADAADAEEGGSQDGQAVLVTALGDADTGQVDHPGQLGGRVRDFRLGCDGSRRRGQRQPARRLLLRRHRQLYHPFLKPLRRGHPMMTRRRFLAAAAAPLVLPLLARRRPPRICRPSAR